MSSWKILYSKDNIAYTERIFYFEKQNVLTKTASQVIIVSYLTYLISFIYL